MTSGDLIFDLEKNDNDFVIIFAEVSNAACCGVCVCVCGVQITPAVGRGSPGGPTGRGLTNVPTFHFPTTQTIDEASGTLSPVPLLLINYLKSYREVKPLIQRYMRTTDSQR